ncbi:hypothetical protein D3C87_1833220 [compost metagenome]
MLARTRIGQHQIRRHRPPQHRSAQHPRREAGQDVHDEQHQSDHSGITDAEHLIGETRQARPLPGTQGYDQPDEQCKTGTFKQEKPAQGNRQQDQRGDDSLFKH